MAYLVGVGAMRKSSGTERWSFAAEHGSPLHQTSGSDYNVHVFLLCVRWNEPASPQLFNVGDASRFRTDHSTLSRGGSISSSQENADQPAQRAFRRTAGTSQDAPWRNPL